LNSSSVVICVSVATVIRGSGLSVDVYPDFTIPASCVMPQYDFKLKHPGSYVWVQNAMYKFLH
jgi:hypothetical protein